jgi:hypothetical protein
MTEAEWLAGDDPRPMLEFLRVRRGATRRAAGRRKFRLVACACLRDVWHLLERPGSREAVEIAERFCDGLESAEGLERGAELARAALAHYRGGDWGPCGQAAEAANHVCRTAYDGGTHPSVVHAAVSTACAWALDRTGQDNALDNHEQHAKMRERAEWVREVFGNPFRPVAFRPEWRTDTAVALALQMNQSRDFSAMPILADALQDAGCDADDVLNHCRGSDLRHLRGCWVADEVLGKGWN